MPARPCTQSQAKRLRKQLATTGGVDESMQDTWTNILVAYQEEVGRIEGLCRKLDDVAGLTSHVKTIPTLVEKLRRFPTQDLLNVDDLAGCRLVTTDVISQNRLLEQLLPQLAAHGYEVKALKDRRWSDGQDLPSEGYRAIHVIARRDWFRCEIQIRTHLQQQWAELFESVCDRWGRGPRYGEPLDHGELPASPSSTMTRAEVLALLRQLSELGENAERNALLIEETGHTLESTDAGIVGLKNIIASEEALLASTSAVQHRLEIAAAIAVRREGLNRAVALNASARLYHEQSQQQAQPVHDSLQAMLTRLACELDQERVNP